MTDSLLQNEGNTTDWYLDKCTQSQAEAILRNTLNGTFLIFPIEPAGYHKMTLTYNYRMFHVLIYYLNFKHFAFGWSDRYKTFDTLNDLVVYYTTHSMAEVNPILKTVLLHPIHSKLIKYVRHYSPPEIDDNDYIDYFP